MPASNEQLSGPAGLSHNVPFKNYHAIVNCLRLPYNGLLQKWQQITEINLQRFTIMLILCLTLTIVLNISPSNDLMHWDIIMWVFIVTVKVPDCRTMVAALLCVWIGPGISIYQHCLIRLGTSHPLVWWIGSTNRIDEQRKAKAAYF